MTENEAFYIIGNIPIPLDDENYDICQYQEAKAIALEALEKIQQYKALGTVEELRIAKEKQIPKKPNKAIDSSWGIKKEVHICPECDCFLTEVQFYTETKIEPNKQITYCDNCGQAIDWSDEE